MARKDDHVADVLRVLDNRADPLPEALCFQLLQTKGHVVTRYATLRIEI
jgi:hypothetical protein